MGIMPSEFWKITPWQFNQCAKAHNQKVEYDHNMTAWGMWHNAVLMRAKGKDFPPLKKYLFGYNESQEKGIDEVAILNAFKSYQSNRDKKRCPPQQS